MKRTNEILLGVAIVALAVRALRGADLREDLERIGAAADRCGELGGRVIDLANARGGQQHERPRAARARR